jgi:ABC-type transport system involved in multi-copper enzyme maturation permease subunit
VRPKETAAAFLAKDNLPTNGLDALIFAIPTLIGTFWGAPLIARELESGTFRVAWTHSVTRTRWLAVKLGVVGLSSIAVVGLLSLMVTWWHHAIDLVNANQ